MSLSVDRWKKARPLLCLPQYSWSIDARSEDSWAQYTTTTHYQKLEHDLLYFQQWPFSGNRRICGFQTEILSIHLPEATGITIFSLPPSFILLGFLRLSLLRQHCYKIFQLAALTSALTKKPEVTGTHTSVSPFEHESSFLFKSTVGVGVTWLVYKFALPCSNFSLLLWRFFLLYENCKH